MIPLQFVLFWAGGKLSYLRYLTFKSLRHFHPNAKIELYVIHQFNKSVHKWDNEQQDFEGELDGKDYLEELPKINVEIKNIKYVGNSDFCLVFQSDLFRWVYLKEHGGIYLDTDQIILKSFETLPLEKEFIYSRYIEEQCGDYIPTGVVALQKDSQIADIALRYAYGAYSPNNYNSSGPRAMLYAFREMDLNNAFNAPFQYFYPVNSSKNVNKIYEGLVSFPNDSFAVHWFGGHILSQKFNNGYTEEFAKTSKDSISKFVRENGII